MSLKQKTREKIITTAVRLFHQKGYNSTGINEVIAQANIAKSTLYQHFSSKDALCVAVLEQRHGLWFAKLKKSLANKINQEDRLLGVFDFVMQMNDEEGFRGCQFLNILSEIPHPSAEVMQVIQDHKNDLQHYIRQIAQPNLTLQASHIYFLLESAIVESQVYRSQEPVLKIKQIVKSFI